MLAKCLAALPWVVLVGIACLAAGEGQEAIDAESGPAGEESELLKVTPDEAVKQLQDTGFLEYCLIEGSLELQGFAPKKEVISLSHVKVEGSIDLSGLKARGLVILAVEAWTIHLDRTELKDLIIESSLVRWGTVTMRKLNDATRLELDFLQPPRKIIVGNRAEAERVHLAAPTVPIVF